MPQYSHRTAERLCHRAGLFFDRESVNIADAIFHEAEFTQHQFNIAMEVAVNHVDRLFRPSNYRILARIYIAAIFLGIAWRPKCP